VSLDNKKCINVVLLYNLMFILMTMMTINHVMEKFLKIEFLSLVEESIKADEGSDVQRIDRSNESQDKIERKSACEEGKVSHSLVTSGTFFLDYCHII